MNTQNGKSSILDALLSHDGVEHVLNTGSMVLGNPVFVLDMSWSVVACSETDEFGKDYWSAFFSEESSEGAIEQLDRAGVYARLLASDEPVFGAIEGHSGRFLGARIRDRADVVGMICLCEEHAFSPMDGELLVDLARSIALEMVYQGQVATRRQPASVLVRELLSGETNASSLDARLKVLGIRPAARMRLVRVCFPVESAGVPLYLTRSQLEHNIPNVICAIHENDVLLVVADDGKGLDFDAILRCCRGDGWKVGVSAGFTSLTELARAGDQALAAIDLFGRLGREEAACEYDKVFLYHFLQSAARNRDLGSFYDPAVLAMRSYDEEHATEFAASVEAYLESGHSMSACAERLFTHRNTVFYRLRKAEKLFGFDLADADRCFSLELTFRLLKVAG